MSLGPTRQQCARTWELYIHSYIIISVSLSLFDLNIHSLTHIYLLCFTDDSLVDVYLLHDGSGDRRSKVKSSTHVDLRPRHPENLYHEMHPASRAELRARRDVAATRHCQQNPRYQSFPHYQSFKRTFDIYNAYTQNYSSFSTYLSYLSSEGRGHR